MTLKLEIAQQILLNAVSVMSKEQVPLAECWQRVLAETVVADTDFPPFDRSPLDGYAVIPADVAAATNEKPVVLRQIDNVPAGSIARETVVPGTACRIMTGAPIPPGASGVVRLEDTASAAGLVEIFDGRGIGQNICRRGEEVAAGEEVISVGTVIRAGVMGMLAVLGKDKPLVFRKPRVALLATGSELIPVSEPLVPGKIRNSNSYMLSGQVYEAGAEPIVLEDACDDVDQIVQRIEEAPECDVYLTTGGASVGDYDLMRQVFDKMGISVMFDRVSMKPGMPVLAGTLGGKVYLGLSGNPASASNAFEQLVRPLLLKMSGRVHWWRPQVKAVLTTAFTKGTGVKRFVWSRCWQEGREYLVEPLGLQGNGMLKSVLAANALIVIPADRPSLASGTEVDVLLLTEF